MSKLVNWGDSNGGGDGGGGFLYAFHHSETLWASHVAIEWNRMNRLMHPIELVAFNGAKQISLQRKAQGNGRENWAKLREKILNK